MMVFRDEHFIDFQAEALPLARKHYLEVATYYDIEMNPDLERYRKLSELGLVKWFTVRLHDTGELIGYASFFIKESLHFKQSKAAVSDLVFIDPHYRGRGGKFISWCEDQLKAMGCQIVYMLVPMTFNWGKILERKEYELHELVYAKRLDVGV